MEYDALLQENRRLQLCLNDLVSVMALPATWVGQEALSVPDSLLDLLQRLIQADLLYLRTHAPAADTPLEWVRAAAADRPALDRLREVATMASPDWPQRLSGDIALYPVPLGLRGELGTLIVGARRGGFPIDSERLLLSVVANLASVALLSARPLEAERRAVRKQQAALDLQNHGVLLQDIADSIAAPVVFLKPDGEIEVINDHLLNFFGKTRAQMEGWKTSEIIHPEDQPATLEALRRAMETGEPYEVEARRRRADGTYRWWRSNGYPMRDAGGSVLRWCVLYTDIQDRRVAEDSLRKQELLVNSLLESIAVPMALWKPNGDAEAMNSLMVEFHGKRLGEVDERELVHPDDWTGAVDAWNRAALDGQPYTHELRLLDAGGDWRWRQTRSFPMRDDSGEIIRWCLLSLDIEDRKRAEEALAASEQRLKQIIDTIPAMAWSANPDGTCDFFNQHHLDYVGRPLQEMTGIGFVSTFHPDDVPHLMGAWKVMMDTGRGGEVEGRLHRSDGTYRWCLFRTNALHDAEGRVVKWFGVNFDIEDRKRAEDALRASELSLRQQTETIPQMLWSALPNGAFDYCNSRFLDYTGSRSRGVMGNGWKDALHPDDQEPTARAWRHSVATGEPYQVEVRKFCAAAGTYHWCLTTALPLRDADGRIVKWHGSSVDIHDRKVAEEALRASARNLAQIINTIPGLTWTAQPDGSEEFISNHYLDYIGLTFEEATGQGWARAIHPDDLNAVVGNWRRALSSGLAGEAEGRMRRPNGEYRWFLFRYNPFIDADGRLVKWFGINIDIEDRKCAEESLRASERNFRGLTESIPQMLWRTTPEGLVDYGNTRFLEYTGFTAPEIMGRDWIRILHPDDVARTERVWGHAVATGEPYHIEYRVRRAADNAYRWCLVTALPLRDEDGSIMKWHGCCVDVHDWKQAQDELRETQSELAHVTRIMTMGQLTASIAHELNQPLSGIMTNAGTGMRMLNGDPPNVQGAMETVRRTLRDAQRASDVITRLRALFARKTSALEIVDINAATQEVVVLASNELQRKGVRLTAELGVNLPYLMGDRVQLQQVILNLILNGAEAMDGVDGRPRALTISTVLDRNGDIRVSVRDHGIGVDASDVEKLFNPFFTTKSSGMGIGLSVSRTIVENHKGRLWAENNAGPGATFCFSIPSTAAEAPI